MTLEMESWKVTTGPAEPARSGTSLWQDRLVVQASPYIHKSPLSSGHMLEHMLISASCMGLRSASFIIPSAPTNLQASLLPLSYQPSPNSH